MRVLRRRGARRIALNRAERCYLCTVTDTKAEGAEEERFLTAFGMTAGLEDCWVERLGGAAIPPLRAANVAALRSG